MSQEPIHVFRTPELAPQVIIVDGQPGCGKTMLSTIVAALDRVELLNYAYELEYICALHFLKKIEDDAATAAVRLFTDLKLYNTMMSRETNFRPSDLSSVFHDAHPWRYLKRLFSEGDRVIPQKIGCEKPILHLTTHNLLPFSQPAFAGLKERLVLIELVRHPLYMIIQQAQNMERLTADVRDFTIYFQYQGQELPYFVHEWEDLFIHAENNVEKAIYAIQKLYARADNERQRLKQKYNAAIITIPFEKFVVEPWPYMEQIEQGLETRMTARTKHVMKKQRVPRNMYADGIDMKVYRRYGWQPPQSKDENEEFRVRRQFALDQASPEAVKMLDQTCGEYEKKYLGGVKDYK